VRDHGLSLRAAAAQVGVSATTVVRWIKEAGEAPAIVPVAPPAPAAPPPAVETTGDALEDTRAMVRQFHADAAAAREAGNHSAAVAAQGHAGKLMILIGRLEKQKGENRDFVKYSRAEIAEAEAGALAKLAAYLNRPLLCAECGEKLSIKWGKGE
jgi:hypothetical protein